MSIPIAFSSATSNIGLPLLVAGQAQKEFFVNQALAILDSLSPRAVLASLPAPPASAVDGDCYLITAPAMQAWEGCENHLALRIGGDWHFVPPREGMRLYDRAADRSLFFRSDWHSAATSTVPEGGTVVDVEARVAIGAIISALRDIGIFSSPGA